MSNIASGRTFFSRLILKSIGPDIGNQASTMYKAQTGNHMQKRIGYWIGVIALIVLLGLGCGKESEELSTEKISEYYPLQVGKFITYQLDSTVYLSLNTVKTVRTYIVQDWVDAEITDNLGRKAYRIRRMIRSNADTTQWTDNATFVATPLNKSVEYVDNNLRFIKLQEPIRADFTWKGNSYINTFSDENLQYLDNWEYFYENVGQSYIVGSKDFPETFVVQQRDEVINDPGDKTVLFSVDKAYEVYARGIGLVYKEFLHEVWQPSNSTCPAGCYEPTSYGIRLTYLNHN